MQFVTSLDENMFNTFYLLFQSFVEIMQHTDYQEGIIVRCIQQLNDTICDVRDAAKTIGNIALREKMEEASNAIKRDIVFAASLYTQSEANYV